MSLFSIEQTVQTSVLSKSWRDLWATHLKFTLDEKIFPGIIDQFTNFIDKTLQGYLDRNLCIDEFCLQLMDDSVLIHEKWTPIVICNMRVKKFKLHYECLYTDPYTGDRDRLLYLNLPSVVFQSQHLQGLDLNGCDLNKAIDSTNNIHLMNLKRLELFEVTIRDDTFQKIISSCPSVEYLFAKGCKELRNIRLIHKAHHLKVFEFDGYSEFADSTEIVAPAIEEISIKMCWNWFHRQNRFLHLKFLRLHCVQVSTKLFDSFSSNFPSVESLKLKGCYGFQKIHLSSASIKHLSIDCFSLCT